MGIEDRSKANHCSEHSEQDRANVTRQERIADSVASYLSLIQTQDSGMLQIRLARTGLLIPLEDARIVPSPSFYNPVVYGFGFARQQDLHPKWAMDNKESAEVEVRR